jgi:hemolysin activation/secretion protein
VQSLPIRATPASGTFRPNPAIVDGDFNAGALTLRRRSEGFAVRRDAAGEIRIEVGSDYALLSGTGHLLIPLGSGTQRLLTRVQAGWGSDELPPHRAFVLGGRATLLGDEFREWGGRRAALVHMELRTAVPFLRVAAGPARTPGSITLAPYVALGWADKPIPSTPWQQTPGTRVTLGIGAEWLGLFRIEAGYGMQSRQVRVSFDVTRDFWDIM